MAPHVTKLMVVLCVLNSVRVNTYSVLFSVNDNLATVNIALSHYSYFCLLIGGGQSTFAIVHVDSPADSGLSTRLCGQSGGLSGGDRVLRRVVVWTSRSLQLQAATNQ